MVPPLRTSPLRRSPIRTSKSLLSSLQANPSQTKVGFSTTKSEFNIDQSRKHRGYSVIKCVFLVIILFIFALYTKVILLAFYFNDESVTSSLLSYRMMKPYGVIKNLIDYRESPSQSSLQNQSHMTSSASMNTSLKKSISKYNTNISKEEAVENPMVESLSSDLQSTTLTQKVFLVPQIPDVNTTGEQKHILSDGIRGSNVLEETLDPDDPDAVWVVNLIKYSCIGKMVPFVQARWDRMVSKGQELRPWKIYLLDFSDNRYRWARDCIEQINAIFGNATITTGEKYVHFGTRQLISFRHIVHKHGDSLELPFAEQGKQIKLKAVDKVVNGTTRALRYGVRSDLVNQIEKIMREKLKEESSDLDIVTYPKQKDVAHFWAPWSRQKDSAALRNHVSDKLLDYAKQPENANLTIFAKQLGGGRRVGRKDLCMEYAQALLEFKIVVVAQRDWYEDHYRLMEALISGAMVMTDPMHPLPYHIEHKKHVVVYNSIAELRNYITYYLNHTEERLAIARSGYEIAMTEHRSWHWMERLVLGDWSNEHGGK